MYIEQQITFCNEKYYVGDINFCVIQILKTWNKKI